jgi:hypothetical protein
MSEVFSLTNFRGDSITFDDTSGIYCEEYDGIAMPEPQRVVQQGPFQHGVTLMGARLGQRVITLKLANLVDPTGTWTKRAAMMAMLNDLKHALYLGVALDDGSTYRMDVYYSGSFTGARAGAHDGFDRNVLQFVADDPVWYEPSVEVINMAISAGGTGMPIPLLIPLTVGGTSVDQTDTFAYAGTWITYPIIRITGPIQSATLTAVADASGTTEKLAFTGITIGAADYYEIDCRYGYKTVKDSTGANKIGDLSSDSDLATFAIRPHPDLQEGINTFHLTGSGATGATNCSISYYTRYIGI